MDANVLVEQDAFAAAAEHGACAVGGRAPAVDDAAAWRSLGKTDDACHPALAAACLIWLDLPHAFPPVLLVALLQLMMLSLLMEPDLCCYQEVLSWRPFHGRLHPKTMYSHQTAASGQNERGKES